MGPTLVLTSQTKGRTVLWPELQSLQGTGTFVLDKIHPTWRQVVSGSEKWEPLWIHGWFLYAEPGCNIRVSKEVKFPFSSSRHSASPAHHRRVLLTCVLAPLRWPGL
jgi:hypothetical protein